jgi:hypothetical protein
MPPKRRSRWGVRSGSWKRRTKPADKPLEWTGCAGHSAPIRSPHQVELSP